MKFVLMLISLLIFTSCGSVTLNPKGCNTNAIWGSSAEQTRHLDARTLNVESIKINSDKTYFVPFNKSIEIKKVLEENNLACESIASVRVLMESKFIFFKKMILFVTLNN